GEVPYGALGDRLTDGEGEVLDLVRAPQRAALEAAVGRAGSSSAVDEHALLRGLLELLRLEGAAGDLLLAVDDVQWLDRPTTAALSFALRRLEAVPIRVLVAARTRGDGGAEGSLGLAELESVTRVVVGPLPATELGAVIREHLGKNLPRPRLKRLEWAAAGNPMFVLELARGDGADGDAHLPPTLSAALEQRLRALDAGL